MIKKILILLSIILALFLCGCTKEVSKKEFVDEAIVKGTDYDTPYTTTSIIPAGKAIVPITNHHPAKYKVYIEYKGKVYEKNNKEYYNQLNGKLGHKIKCKFIKAYYNDNTSKIELLEIEKVE